MAKKASLAIQIMEHVNKTRKSSVIQALGSSEAILVVDDVLSTGLPDLDRILAVSKSGSHGIPVGRILNIEAKPSVGKTTFLLRLCRQVQKRKGLIWMVESEHALERSYIKKVGVDDEEMLISQPDTLEESLEIIETAVKACQKLRDENNNAPFLVMMDSFSGFSPEAEMEGGGALGEHARQASKFCRKMTGAISRAKVIFVVVHQIKSKIGITWGNPNTHIGGDAFNFHGSITLSFVRKSAIKEGTKVIGHNGSIRTIKNKLMPPFQEVDFRLINGKGFDANFSILKALIKEKVVIKKGAWFHFRDDKSIKFQGSDNFVDVLKDNVKARKLTRQILGMGKTPKKRKKKIVKKSKKKY
jgi:recombination protein RecA